MACFGKMGGFIRSCDFVSPEVKLRTYGLSRFKTVLGGVMSIITILIVILLTMYFFQIFFSQMIIILTPHTIVSYIEEVTFTNFPVHLSFVDKSGAYIRDADQIFSIEAEYVSLNKTMSRIQFGVEKCSNDKLLTNDNFDVVSKQNYYCLSNTEEIKLYGYMGTNSYSELYFHISTCNSANKTCKNNSEISSILKNSYISVKCLDYETDHFNRSYPGQERVQLETFQISPEHYFEYSYKYRNVSYNSDNAYVFYESTYSNYYYMEPSTNLAFSNTNSTRLSSVKFSMSNKKDYYKRHYMKFQEALANVMGVLEACLIANFIIEKYILGKIFYSSLVNELISFESYTANSPNVSKKLHRKMSANFYDRENVNKKISLLKYNNYFQREVTINNEGASVSKKLSRGFEESDLQQRTYIKDKT